MREVFEVVIPFLVMLSGVSTVAFGWRWNQDDIALNLHNDGKKVLDEFEHFAIKTRRDMLTWGVYGSAMMLGFFALLWWLL